MNDVGVKAHRRAAWPMPDKLDDWRSLQIALARYAFSAQFVKGKTVLDLACGGGYGSAYLRRKGAHMVVGGDAWPEAIAYATRSYGKDSTHFAWLDACHLPFADGSFDVIASFETIRYMTEPEKFISECHRVLKPGGLFICSTPNREATSEESHSELVSWRGHEYNGSELREVAAGCFSGVQVYGLNRVEPKNTAATRGFLSWAGRIALVASRIPGVLPVMNFAAGLVSPKYRLVRLERISQWDRMLDPELKPYLLDNGAGPPTCLVAVGKRPS